MSDHIPFEVQAEIMKRLPTKSLMQFRSVSKPWKSLIDSRKFIAGYSFNQQHLLVSYVVPVALKQIFVSVVDDDTFPQQKFSFPEPVPGLGTAMVLGSSQGLFALYSFDLHPTEPERTIKTFVFWNPSIRKSVAIDVLDEMADPLSHFVIGFGVCPRTRDPKLVRIDSSYNKSNTNMIIFTPWKLEVYSLSSRAWSSIPTVNQPRESVCLLCEQVVINEFIYWLAVHGFSASTELESQLCNLIVSFDLTSEGFMEVSLPDTVACAYRGNVVISKVNESLVVVEVVKHANKQVYVVWMMEHSVSNSFAKLFSINSPDASIKNVLGFWKLNEPIFAMRTDYEIDEVFIHHVQSEHINYIGISGNAASHHACSYVETLLLLDY